MKFRNLCATTALLTAFTGIAYADGNDYMGGPTVGYLPQGDLDLNAQVRRLSKPVEHTTFDFRGRHLPVTKCGNLELFGISEDRRMYTHLQPDDTGNFNFSTSDYRFHGANMLAVLDACEVAIDQSINRTLARDGASASQEMQYAARQQIDGTLPPIKIFYDIKEGMNAFVAYPEGPTFRTPGLPEMHMMYFSDRQGQQYFTAEMGDVGSHEFFHYETGRRGNTTGLFTNGSPLARILLEHFGDVGTDMFASNDPYLVATVWAETKGDFTSNESRIKKRAQPFGQALGKPQLRHTDKDVALGPDKDRPMEGSNLRQSGMEEHDGAEVLNGVLDDVFDALFIIRRDNANVTRETAGESFKVAKQIVLDASYEAQQTMRKDGADLVSAYMTAFKAAFEKNLDAREGDEFGNIVEHLIYEAHRRDVGIGADYLGADQRAGNPFVSDPRHQRRFNCRYHVETPAATGNCATGNCPMPSAGYPVPRAYSAMAPVVQPWGTTPRGIYSQPVGFLGLGHVDWGKTLETTGRVLRTGDRILGDLSTAPGRLGEVSGRAQRGTRIAHGLGRLGGLWNYAGVTNAGEQSAPHQGVHHMISPRHAAAHGERSSRLHDRDSGWSRAEDNSDSATSDSSEDFRLSRRGYRTLEREVVGMGSVSRAPVAFTPAPTGQSYQAQGFLGLDGAQWGSVLHHVAYDAFGRLIR